MTQDWFFLDCGHSSLLFGQLCSHTPDALDEPDARSPPKSPCGEWIGVERVGSVGMIWGFYPKSPLTPCRTDPLAAYFPEGIEIGRVVLDRHVGLYGRSD